MFERYTEKSRRIIFFARSEGSQLGSLTIRGEHLLLGLLRETPDVAVRYLRVDASALTSQLRSIPSIPDGEVATDVGLPLDLDSKRILARAAEAAERLGESPEHILLGVLREASETVAEVLRTTGALSAAEGISAIEASATTRAQRVRPEIAADLGREVTLRLPLGTVPRVGETVLLTTPDEPDKEYSVSDIRWEVSRPSTEGEARINGVELRLRPKHL